jgi:hypothetical protein
VRTFHHLHFIPHGFIGKFARLIAYVACEVKKKLALRLCATPESFNTGLRRAEFSIIQEPGSVNEFGGEHITKGIIP